MARSFPRFLFSKATQSKSKGTFIIHTLEPSFIAEVDFDDARQLQDATILKVFNGDEHYFAAREIIEAELANWWKFSGIHESSDERDKLISALSKIPFITDKQKEYTIEEAREMIKIIFPTKSKKVNKNVSSYGLKHDFERLSMLFINGYSNKYCNNETIKQAFALEGFEHISDGPNEYYNITDRELNRMRKISFYIANNRNNSKTGIY